MANSFVTLKTIARQALPRLIENLVFPNLVYRDFSNEFHDLGDTIRVRRPVILKAEDFDAEAGVNYQDMQEDAVEVSLDHLATVDARASAIETATCIDDLNRIFIEAAAAALTRRVAERFAPLEVDIRHVGIFPGGKVLFAAPDMRPSLVALQAACESPLVNGHPWTPHTTLLIDQPEVIGAAVPVLMQRFTPLRARINRLHLCAFWPTREILRVPLAGKE